MLSPTSAGREAMLTLRDTLTKAVLYSERQMTMLTVTYAAGGHVLCRGPRGTGKTLCAKALARAHSNASFNRVTCVPDMMPADILGTEMFTTEKGFTFLHGPIFGNIMFADEINRTPPKTQNCFLEPLEEGTVSTGGVTAGRRELPKPHVIIATRNLASEDPNVFDMSYPLLDRFAVELLFHKHTVEQVAQIAALTAGDRHGLSHAAQGVIGLEDVVALRNEIEASTKWGEDAAMYAARLVCSIDQDLVAVGMDKVFDGNVEECSPARAVQWMLRLGRARAFMEGRDCVNGDDLKYVFPEVVRHRIVMSQMADSTEWNAERVIKLVLERVKPFRTK